MFVAALRHVGSRRVAVPNRSAQHPPYARPSRQVEKHQRIARTQPRLERPRIIAVHHPSLALDKPIDRSRPFRFRRFDPARLPIQRVEVDDLKPEQFAELSSEGRLARAARSDNKDLLHYIYLGRRTVAFSCGARSAFKLNQKRLLENMLSRPSAARRC